MTNYSECELTELSVYSDYCSDDYEVMTSGMSKSIPHVGINDSLLLYCVVVTIRDWVRSATAYMKCVSPLLSITH